MRRDSRRGTARHLPGGSATAGRQSSESTMESPCRNRSGDRDACRVRRWRHRRSATGNDITAGRQSTTGRRRHRRNTPGGSRDDLPHEHRRRPRRARCAEADRSRVQVRARRREAQERRGTDGATSDGWTWKINADGTAGSRGAKGEWESFSEWWFENGRYCRHGAGESAATAGCSSVYELDGVYRFGSDTDPDNPGGLAGWSVEVGGWNAGKLLYDGETLNARNLSAMKLLHPEGRPNSSIRSTSASAARKAATTW